MPVELPDNEKELLLLIAAGDENAFKKLFHLHHNKLAAFILNITTSMPVTEEIVQDAFLKIWLSRAELPNINNFQAYLFVIARNRAFNQLKQQARKQTREINWMQLYGQDAAAELHNAAYATYEEQIALVEKAINQLPPQQKKVYILSRYEQMKHEDIAASLSLSTETVKKHIMLAMRFIRQYVNNHAGTSSILLLLPLIKKFL